MNITGYLGLKKPKTTEEVREVLLEIGENMEIIDQKIKEMSILLDQIVEEVFQN